MSGHKMDRLTEHELAEPLAEGERDALRRAAAGGLQGDPVRDASGLELWVRQTELAIWIYRDPAAATAALAEVAASQPDPSPELAELGSAARSLARRISELGDDARKRLLETGALEPAALDTLRVLGGVAAAACDAVARDAEAPPLQPAGDELTLVERLSAVWVEHTGERIAEDPAGQSAFACFVETACSIAGLGAEDAHRARLRVSRTLGLLESAEMLATLPED